MVLGMLGMLVTAATLRRQARSMLSCLGLVLLPACLDCFDDGELEASYHAGQATAREVNEREFAHGYDDGLALTQADGELDGQADGYAAGHHDGYYGPYGYPQGIDDGYGSGHVDGLLDPAACEDGSHQGYLDGEVDGYTAGFDDGYDTAFDDGYTAGYADGASSCGFRAARDRPNPSELDTCEARGYTRALDRSAFPRGFDAGKADNPDYQASYETAHALAYPRGAIDGELDGYDDGFTEGYDAGFIDGYDQSFQLCYDEAHLAGYDAGLGSGYDVGLGAGYDVGYDDGYDDGRAQCPE